MIKDKVLTRKELVDRTDTLKKEGKTVGFTNGCFDIIHPGHVRYLEKAGAECDVLVVGVNSDSSVKRLKGPGRPVNDEYCRIEVMAALESVDFVSVFEENTPEELIRAIGPSVIFKGGDWKEDQIAGADFVRAAGGSVRILKFEKGFSTTDLISRLSTEE